MSWHPWYEAFREWWSFKQWVCLFFFFHSIFMFVISAYYGKRDILKIVVLTSLENWFTWVDIFLFLCVMTPLFCLVALVDITIYYNGFHGDLNETFFVGEVDEESKQLVKVTYECISQAIAAGILCWKFYTTCIHNYFKWILLNMFDSMLIKKIMFDSLGLVDFAIGILNSVLNLLKREVKFWGEFITEELYSILFINFFFSIYLVVEILFARKALFINQTNCQNINT